MDVFRKSVRVSSLVLATVIVSGVAVGCAMRVTGVVRDQATGNPIGGAVLSAADGRNRLSVTDPLGRYNVKTDKQATTLTVSAPGYQTTTVPVAGDSSAPTADVNLEPLSRSRVGEPLVKPLGQATVTDDIPTGAAAKFRQLRDLYDRGLISNQEYQEARKRIVGDL